MDLGLDGRVALVLGGSRGIGRAIAAELAAEGARVAVASRNPEGVEEFGARAFVHDNADLDSAPALVERITHSLGPIEVLVTNTGGPPAGDPLGHPRDDWEAAYRTLVLAPMTFIELVLPAMREHRWGRIVNVASSTVREPAAALMLSNSHRSALLAAFKTLSRQLAPDGVTLNTVLPGRIATERLFDLFGSRAAAERDGAADVPAGRLGTVEEMAAAAVFLCSARASYITGTALLVDGALTHAT